MYTCFLGLGSNLGDKVQMIERAYEKISQHCGKIIAKSGFYKTPPWGFQSIEDFVNTVIKIETELEVNELLAAVKKIEFELGRKEKTTAQNYEDRLIDIDILDFNGEQIINSNLQVPHPRIELRDFVLIPLAEIEPEWEHPILKKDVFKLLNNLPGARFIDKLN